MNTTRLRHSETSMRHTTLLLIKTIMSHVAVRHTPDTVTTRRHSTRGRPDALPGSLMSPGQCYLSRPPAPKRKEKDQNKPNEKGNRTMIPLFDFPRRDVFTRWEEAFPAEAATDRDPRGPYPCQGDGCQTFEWRGYDGLCGWCHEQR